MQGSKKKQSCIIVGIVMKVGEDILELTEAVKTTSMFLFLATVVFCLFLTSCWRGRSLACD